MKNKNNIITPEETLGQIAVYSAMLTTKISQTNGDTEEQRFVNYFKALSIRLQYDDSIEKRILSIILMYMDKVIQNINQNDPLHPEQLRISLLPRITINTLIVVVVCKKSLRKFSAYIADDTLRKIDFDEELDDGYFSKLFTMEKDQLLEE